MSPAEPLDQFQPNLAQCNFVWTELNFFFINQPSNSQEEDNKKISLILWHNHWVLQMFIDWNYFSCERCGPWASCYYFHLNELDFAISECLMPHDRFIFTSVWLSCLGEENAWHLFINKLASPLSQCSWWNGLDGSGGMIKLIIKLLDSRRKEI